MCVKKFAQKVCAFLAIAIGFFAFFTLPRALPQSDISRYTRGFEWQHPLVGKETAAEYYLGAGDTLDISVWKNPDLSRSVKISTDGTVSLPLVGSIKA